MFKSPVPSLDSVGRQRPSERLNLLIPERGVLLTKILRSPCPFDLTQLFEIAMQLLKITALSESSDILVRPDEVSHLVYQTPLLVGDRPVVMGSPSEIQ